MPFGCGSKNSKLEKNEKEELIHLLKKTETRVEFFKKLHEVSQYNYTLSRTKTKQIFDILKDIIEKEKKYQDKFYSIEFLYMFLKKYEKSRERFASSSLMQIILDSLKVEIKQMREYIDEDKIKLWRERYVIVCIELMIFLIHYNKQMFSKYSDFMNTYNVDVDREPFYSKITYPLILDIKTDAGKIIRRPIN